MMIIRRMPIIVILEWEKYESHNIRRVLVSMAITPNDLSSAPTMKQLLRPILIILNNNNNNNN